jgi:micrococcal nuclease
MEQPTPSSIVSPRALFVALLTLLLLGSVVSSSYAPRTAVPQTEELATVGTGTVFSAQPAVASVAVGPGEIAPDDSGMQRMSQAGGAPAGSEQGVVVSVVDGDTIDVRINGVVERVRYIGMDTPETVDPRKPVQCFGKEASAKNTELALGKVVTLERDVSERDRYGRLLRYVYVNGVMINEALVREGYAHVYTYPPDVKYDTVFREAERAAREQGRGLWGPVCATYVPAPASTPVAATQNDAGCTIKGNISASGDKIYHSPGCGSYAKTVINEDKGERWFCSEQEALDAGWRKALNC